MTSTIIDGKKAFVELRFGPNWEYISTVRNFIINFLAITLDDKKRADRIAMAVNELVENAIKYSVEDGIEINLEVLKNSHQINVTVRNHGSEDQYEILNNIITEINNLPPLEAYMKRMKESATKMDKESNIGLARIRYETNANISPSYNDQFITVHAEFTS